MHHHQLARELLKQLRGRRSQRQLSRQLGYQSNVLYRWESGRSWPSAEAFFALVDHVRGRGGSRRCLEEFLREQPLTAGQTLKDSAVLLEVLGRLRGEARINDIARQLGCSRFVVARWLNGTTCLRLPELLAYVEATTLRLLDFLAAFASPAQLPSVRKQWQLLEASRRSAYEHPWSHAVLRVLETRAYQQLKRHRRGWIAERIGLSVKEEETCLEVLRQAGQIRLQRGRLVVCETRTIDTRARPDQAHNLKAFWLGVAAERQKAEHPGVYAYNVCSMSDADLHKLRQMHQAFFADMRRLIAASEPCERVVLLATQLVALDAGAASAES